MRLYLEINGEKHYLDEGVVKKNALYEGQITPLTRLEIKRENEPTLDNETIIALPAAIDDSEINTEINKITGSEDSIDVVEPIPEFSTVDEFSKDVKTPNEGPSKPEDKEGPILLTGIDDPEINKKINGIIDSKNSTDVVEPIPGSTTVSDESPADTEEPNETFLKPEDTGSQESSTTEVNESVIKKNPRKSKLDPYLSVMKELIEKDPDITSVQVYNELCEAGFDGGKTIVTDRLSQIRRRDLESKENHDQAPH